MPTPEGIADFRPDLPSFLQPRLCLHRAAGALRLSRALLAMFQGVR